MLVSDVTRHLEEFAPLQLQESYDNSGLLVGKLTREVTGVLISVDMTEEVLDEALEKNCNLVISHHPLIFGGIKKLTGQTAVERIVEEAVKNEIAIYALHTNLDNVNSGVNRILCEKIGLTRLRILSPKSDLLGKLVTFAPEANAAEVRSALFEAGAGQIGNYDSCSFNLEGTGSFRGSDQTNPFVGEKGKLNYEKEIRIEVVYPRFRESKILNALFQSHPYEEVAFDLYPLANELHSAGAGMIGELPAKMSERKFLEHLKKTTGTQCLRHSGLTGRKVLKVAVCGGAGSFLIKKAIAEKADVFVSGDIKYHDFFLAEKKLVIADVGHYESEQFVKELIYTELIKKFPNFAVLISEAITNSINYL
jgi:dinuclear metal center YbgI/SA1388 family protein